MKSMTGVLINLGLCLSSATAMAAAPQEDNRASMLSILLVAGVMIVVVKLVIAYARKKMEEDIQAAQEKPGSEARENDSQSNG